MLRHAIAPTRDFTQISNAHTWDDDLSDTAFRLLVRALALPPAKARRTTVTDLAAGLTGGRITADRARRQLGRKGLLHSTRWRCGGGQVRTESLIANVPLDDGEAERMFATHFETSAAKPPGPGAGERQSGRAAPRASGTALPSGVTQPEDEHSPLPVPPELPVAPEERHESTAEAERLLLSLRRTDPRLVLGGSEVRNLAPLAAAWLALGVSPAGLVHALTAGLPSR